MMARLALLGLLGAGCASPPASSSPPAVSPGGPPVASSASPLAVAPRGDASATPAASALPAGPLAAAPRGSASAPSTPALLDCDFFPIESPQPAIRGCARVGEDGQLTLTPRAIAAVRTRSASGPVAALIEGKMHYVNAAGRAAQVLLFDNGADDFEEGLARTVRGGKIGYLDRSLVERVPPRWDFGFPFQGGVAIVCQGCREQQDGEHTSVVGGLWGYIDHQGNVVVPVTFSRDQLPAPPPGKPGKNKRKKSAPRLPGDPLRGPLINLARTSAPLAPRRPIVLGGGKIASWGLSGAPRMPHPRFPCFPLLSHLRGVFIPRFSLFFWQELSCRLAPRGNPRMPVAPAAARAPWPRAAAEQAGPAAETGQGRGAQMVPGPAVERGPAARTLRVAPGPAAERAGWARAAPAG
jgi:hypothetical protein